MWQQNYKLDTKQVIGGMVEEGTHEGDVVRGHVVHEKYCDL
jgi:hypothetical protein